MRRIKESEQQTEMERGLRFQDSLSSLTEAWPGFLGSLTLAPWRSLRGGLIPEQGLCFVQELYGSVPFCCLSAPHATVTTLLMIGLNEPPDLPRGRNAFSTEVKGQEDWERGQNKMLCDGRTCGGWTVRVFVRTVCTCMCVLVSACHILV